MVNNQSLKLDDANFYLLLCNESRICLNLLYNNLHYMIFFECMRLII